MCPKQEDSEDSFHIKQHISDAASFRVLGCYWRRIFLFDRQDEASVWGPFAGVWLALQMLASVGVTFNKLKVPRLQSTIKM